MKTLFCTNSKIGYGTGGGVVSYHILKSLIDSPSQVQWYDPSCGGYSRVDPYAQDVFISNDVKERKFDFAVFYGGSYGLTAKKAYPAKLISDVAPHNIEVSREEHERLGLSFNYPHLVEEDEWRRYTLHLAISDLVIVHSEMSMEYLRNKLQLENITAIPHGCDVPPSIPPLPDRFIVAHLGVNGPDKGQTYLVDAWRNLKLKDASCILAGVGTKVWKPFCIGLGPIPDISPFYKNCSVYVQPTVTEGFGITVFEAMSYGRPVIVTEGAGVSEWVEDGKEGFVVPIRDAEAIRDKLLYYYNNLSEVERMGRNARKRAEDFSWDKIRQGYKQLYKSVQL